MRGLVCSGESPPCEECDGCRRTSPREEIIIDGTGRRGPLLRHVGDHPDLLWVERGPDDTRVRIGQIRALQNALRFRSTESGRRAAVIADAEWLNLEAQNALLRLLEEPPPDTTLVLVTTTSSGLIATVRSRCQRVTFRSEEANPLDDPEFAELVARLESVGRATVCAAGRRTGPRSTTARPPESKTRSASRIGRPPIRPIPMRAPRRAHSSYTMPP